DALRRSEWRASCSGTRVNGEPFVPRCRTCGAFNARLDRHPLRAADGRARLLDRERAGLTVFTIASLSAAFVGTRRAGEPSLTLPGGRRDLRRCAAGTPS